MSENCDEMISDGSPPPAYYNTIVVAEGDGMKAVEWYKTALNAKDEAVYKNKDGTVMHAFMKSAYGFPFGIDEMTPKECNVDPATGTPTRGSATYMYINVAKPYTSDEAVKAMEDAGATVTHPPRDLFYGHRVGRVVDKFGASWAFSSECTPAMDCMPDKWGH